MISCDHRESQAAFCIMTVAYAHELRTILVQEILNPLLAGYEWAFGSHSLLSRAAGTRAAKQH